MILLALALACSQPSPAAAPPEAIVSDPSCIAVWQRHRGDAVPLDAAAFPDVAEVDATSVSEERRVGRVTEATRTALGDRGVVEALVRADVIKIYAHMEGLVCLVSETNPARVGPVPSGNYAARFTGHHVYYTNQRNEASMTFEVRIAPDGTITLLP